MKKKLLLPIVCLTLGLLAGCGGNGGKTSKIPTIKQSENAFKDYTGKQFLDLGFKYWTDKADDPENPICYYFNGDYTEAYARQLYPTYFDCYLYADGSVFGTYKANYVDSEADANGRYYYLDGDGHADNEVWFGYWYNLTDEGDKVLNIQWLGYGDYYSGHMCDYNKTSDAILGGDRYSAAVSLTINGNSRTCFIYGNEFSPYKKDSLTITENAKVKKNIKGCDQVFNPGYVLSATHEDGTTSELMPYLFDWSFDKDGNVTAEYPLMGLKSTGAVKVNVTPTVYETKIKVNGSFVDCKITRDSSEFGTLELMGKKQRFSYDEIYYRTVLDITGWVDDPINTATAEELSYIETKYFFIGKGNEYAVGDSLAKEVVSDPRGTDLCPELGHYTCAEDNTKLSEGVTLSGAYNGKATDMDKVHVERTKGITGVHTQACELIRFKDFAHTDSKGNALEVVAFRILVNTNGEFVDYMGYVSSYDEATHELKMDGIHKWGNNINGRTYMKGVILNDTNHTFTVSVPDTNVRVA